MTGVLVDEGLFAGLAESHRRELRAHVQRIIGSYDESEDLVQEALTRAWGSRATFQGRSTFRTWLIRIATNVSVDFLNRSHRRRYEMPADTRSRGVAVTASTTRTDPNLDHMLAGITDPDPAPDEQAASRETTELVVMVAIQHLPSRQRAVLILRDLFGWPAADIATLLNTSVAAVNSASQRARATIRERFPAQRGDWPTHPARTSGERALVKRYMKAIDRVDPTAVGALVATACG